MSVQIALQPLLCTACQSPILANPEEIAWVCDNCGAGILLRDDLTLTEQRFHFSNGVKPKTAGLPFWVVNVKAELQRETFGSNRQDEMEAFWQLPRKVFIAAYKTELDDLVQKGVKFLHQPPDLTEGPIVEFLPVIVSPADLQAYVEFIVFQLEAERRDNLKKLYLKVEVSDPELWLLPAQVG